MIIPNDTHTLNAQWEKRLFGKARIEQDDGHFAMERNEPLLEMARTIFGDIVVGAYTDPGCFNLWQKTGASTIYFGCSEIVLIFKTGRAVSFESSEHGFLTPKDIKEDL